MTPQEEQTAIAVIETHMEYVKKLLGKHEERIEKCEGSIDTFSKRLFALAVIIGVASGQADQLPALGKIIMRLLG